jgi:hypothetical protein
MGGGGGWDYDYSESALQKSSKDYKAEAASAGVFRNYKGHESAGLPPPVGKQISTASPTPLVVAVDVSGSMSHWPSVIFDKLPVLYNEARLHLPEVEISFCAIGDPSCHMLQVCDFQRGKDLEEGINAIHPCGRDEYFELALAYYAEHCTLTKAERGLFVICGNEEFRPTVLGGHRKDYLGDASTDLKSIDVFKKVKEKFDLYMLYVPTCSGIDDWRMALGKQMVLEMHDPSRIVDCIIGLCAIFADDYASFEKRLAIRQTPEQVKQVLSTLHPVTGKKPAGKKK